MPLPLGRGAASKEIGPVHPSFGTPSGNARSGGRWIGHHSLAVRLRSIRIGMMQGMTVDTTEGNGDLVWFWPLSLVGLEQRSHVALIPPPGDIVSFMIVTATGRIPVSRQCYPRLQGVTCSIRYCFLRPILSSQIRKCLSQSHKLTIVVS